MPLLLLLKLGSVRRHKLGFWGYIQVQFLRWPQFLGDIVTLFDILTFVHNRVSKWWTWCSVASRYSSDWCCFMTWSPWHNYVDYCTVILFKSLNHYCITILCNHFPLIPYCNGSVAWTIKHSYSYSFTPCLVFHNDGTSTDSFRETDFIFLGYFVNTTNTSWPRSHC